MSINPKMQIAIVGNPNSGKTTFFNALTGSTHAIGNWAGVTVEKKSEMLVYQDKKIEVVDLPGCYSLLATDELSQDETVTIQYLSNHQPDKIINVIDVTNLERQLYLTYQLLARFSNVTVVLTMQDVAEKLEMLTRN